MDNVVWLDTAREIAVELGADGFIVGRFADYSDEVTIGTPYNATTASPPEWRVDQTTRADVTLEVRLIDVHTGTVVYERRAEGSGRIDDTRLLNWSSPSSPPDALIPTPHRRDVRHAREQAIQHAFAAFAEDILPQRQGVPADDGDITDHEDLTDHEDINGGVSDAHI